jgi:hypothetical protein
MKYIRNTPWRSVEDQSDVPYSHTIVDSDGRRIAKVDQLTDPVRRNQDSKAHEAATARLLASAPELHTKLLECAIFLDQERRRIDRAIKDIYKFLESIEGEFSGEEFEVPPLKVNSEAISGRLAFLESLKQPPDSGGK